MKKGARISGQSGVRLVVGLAIIGLFVAVLIVPGHLKIKTLDRQIAETRAEIATQKILFPAYQKLKNKLEADPSEVLPIISTKALDRDGVSEIDALIGACARSAGVSVTSVKPDPLSLSRGNRLLMVNCEFSGTYLRMRELLLEIGRIPALKQMKGLQVREAGSSVDCAMQLWFSLEAM